VQQRADALDAANAELDRRIAELRKALESLLPPAMKNAAAQSVDPSQLAKEIRSFTEGQVRKRPQALLLTSGMVVVHNSRCICVIMLAVVVVMLVVMSVMWR
jgi:hypothetical protein